MTTVKICGLMREADVALACTLGAGAVGFNFVSSSARRLTLERARRLAGETPRGVLRVGVFASAETLVIRTAVEKAGLDVAQLHRPLRQEDVDSLGVPVIAVAGVGPDGPELPPAARLSKCRALLFDTLAADLAGGTGRTFDWRAVAGRDFGVPIVIAGGLNADNVAEAARRVRPWAVDVASGVESAPGVKDPEKMRRFIEAVRDADANAA